jgi:hypothetical protein
MSLLPEAPAGFIEPFVEYRLLSRCSVAVLAIDTASEGAAQ